MDCKVCYSKYDTNMRVPRTLECGHTFCEACLGGTASIRGKCPLCNRAVKRLPPREYPKNFALIEAMESNLVKRSSSNMSQSGVFGSPTHRDVEYPPEVPVSETHYQTSEIEQNLRQRNLEPSVRPQQNSQRQPQLHRAQPNRSLSICSILFWFICLPFTIFTLIMSIFVWPLIKLILYWKFGIWITAIISAGQLVSGDRRVAASLDEGLQMAGDHFKPIGWLLFAKRIWERYL